MHSVPWRWARIAGSALILLITMGGPSARAQDATLAEQRLDRAFDNLDQDENGRLEADEVPPELWERLHPGPVKDAPVAPDRFENVFGRQLSWFGVWSLVPAVIALGLAFWTRNVLVALFIGVVSGAIVQFFQMRFTAGVWAPKELDFIDNAFLRALGTSNYATILLVYLWFLGGIVGIWNKTGAAKHFAEVVGARLVRGPNTARLFAWIIGVIFHQGGTVSTVLAGSTVRPVADRHKVSHEELSYIVDSTASPVATILPFNAWPFYIGGTVAGATAVGIGGFELIPDADLGRSWFYRSIKFNFYGMFAILFTLLFGLGILPAFGKMKRALDRARTTGALDGPEAKPLIQVEDVEGESDPDYRVGLEDFLLPLGLLLVLAVGPPLLYWLGLVSIRVDLIKHAFLASTMGAILIAVVKGMPLAKVLDGFLDGCKSMTIGAIILGLAVTLGQISKDLGTGDFVVALIGDALPAWLLPASLTLACMIIAFAVGSSWSTYAVIFPIAVPLAVALGAARAGIDPAAVAEAAANGGAAWNSVLFYVQVCFGAVIGGAVFGDQCSPISDTTVLSSMFTGCDLMDHVTTQAPISLVAAGLGALCSTALVLAF